MVETLIPEWLCNYDSDAGVGYFLIFAPVCYYIIGMISGFFLINKICPFIIRIYCHYSDIFLF